jgi:hypothetical protein
MAKSLKSNIQCKHCPKVLTHAETLLKHVRLFHPDIVAKHWFLCDVCDTYFPTESGLEYHTSNVHKTTKSEFQLKPKYHCKPCLQTWFTRDKFLKHFRNFHFEDVAKNWLPCKICNFPFPDQIGVDAHTGVVHKASLEEEEVKVGELLLQCDFCKTQLSSEAGFLRHMRSIHLDIVKKDWVPCNICNVYFPDGDTLEGHKNESHKCSYCPMILPSNAKVVRHLVTCHPDKVEKDINSKFNLIGARKKVALRIQCDYCPTTFSRKESLLNHLITHHSDRVEKDSFTYKLVQAYKVAKDISKSNLKKAKARFPCNYCSKTLSSKPSVQRHNKRWHSDKVEKDNNSKFNLTEASKKFLPIFQCGYCTTTFLRKETLLNHLSIHHSDKVEKDSYVYKLVQAYKSAKEISKSNLKKAMPKFPCNYCPTTLSRKDSVERHLRACHPDKVENGNNNKLKVHEAKKRVRSRFQCDHCPTTFSRKKTLVIHLRKYHSDKINKDGSSCNPVFATNNIVSTLNSQLCQTSGIHTDNNNFNSDETDKNNSSSKNYLTGLFPFDDSNNTINNYNNNNNNYNTYNNNKTNKNNCSNNKDLERAFPDEDSNNNKNNNKNNNNYNNYNNNEANKNNSSINDLNVLFPFDESKNNNYNNYNNNETNKNNSSNSKDLKKALTEEDSNNNSNNNYNNRETNQNNSNNFNSKNDLKILFPFDNSNNNNNDDDNHNNNNINNCNNNNFNNNDDDNHNNSSNNNNKNDLKRLFPFDNSNNNNNDDDNHNNNNNNNSNNNCHNNNNNNNNCHNNNNNNNDNYNHKNSSNNNNCNNNNNIDDDNSNNKKKMKISFSDSEMGE